MGSIDAVLFDMGGTLDGRGGWRDRFHQLFLDADLVQFSRDARAAAFDYAERCSHRTPEMCHARFESMVERHVGWQFEHLGLDDPGLARQFTAKFTAAAREAAVVNRGVLRALSADGLRLGLVSNACGNAAVLCDDFGYAPMLTIVVDSQVFGRAKPDPEIFHHALALIGAPAARSAFVGDSFDRDIEPAKQLGMTTFWVAPRPVEPHERATADVILESLADLPESLRRMQFERV